MSPDVFWSLGRPYRVTEDGEVRLVVRRERSVCVWCTYSYRHGDRCTVRRDRTGGSFTYILNTANDCRDFRPSIWTRLVRRIGLRPALIDEVTKDAP